MHQLIPSFFWLKPGSELILFHELKLVAIKNRALTQVGTTPIKQDSFAGEPENYLFSNTEDYSITKGLI